LDIGSGIGKIETLKRQNHFESLQHRPYNILSKTNNKVPQVRHARGRIRPQNSLESKRVQQFQGNPHSSFQRPKVYGSENNKQPDSQQELISKPRD